MSKNKTLTQSDIKSLEEIFVTKDDLQEFKSELFDKIDPILKEVVDGRDERTILTHKLSNHEDRIEALEQIHPDLKHPHTL